MGMSRASYCQGWLPTAGNSNAIDRLSKLPAKRLTMCNFSV